MKVVLAFDSFKGTMDAPTACRVAAEAVRIVRPSARTVEKPMADGGEGTAEILRRALDGERVELDVQGPLPGRRVRAAYTWVAARKLAIVEMAAASGITLVSREERDPFRATTFGTGELLRDAETRAGQIWLTVGGSATVDGGIGAAQALGWRFEDAVGRAVGQGGLALNRIARILSPVGFHPPPVTVLCDVENPLCGPEGAARVFSPQKGATPEQVIELERGLANLAEKVRSDLGMDISGIRGGGAAGGLAAGAAAFMGARLKPGIDVLIDAVGLSAELSDADWVIAGEGRLDATSLRGKVVSGVLREARCQGARVAVVAGQIALSESEWRAAGIDQVGSLIETAGSAQAAMERPAHFLAESVRRLTGAWGPVR
ncbi:MAG: glycerate kinase [Kiritimatiellia bacterium]|nr:glycerate kinase [Kiritimatiellia bacterium]